MLNHFTHFSNSMKKIKDKKTGAVGPHLFRHFFKKITSASGNNHTAQLSKALSLHIDIFLQILFDLHVKCQEMTKSLV